MFHHRIGRSCYIQIRFELKDMIVHRPREVIVNLVSVSLVFGVKGGLNISRSSDDRLDGSVEMKHIVEVVIIADISSLRARGDVRAHFPMVEILRTVNAIFLVTAT